MTQKKTTTKKPAPTTTEPTKLTRALNDSEVRTLKTEKHYRKISIEKEAIDEEARTISVAFSSELPCRRWYGNEILDHTADSVRLARLADGGAVLWMHDWHDQRGVIESVSLDSDRRGRALLRVGRNPAAEELWQDVLDGIKRHISVGYRIIEMTLERENEETGERDYRVTDWEPFEISFVSVPFDPTVGVGRSMDLEPEPEKSEPTYQETAEPETPESEDTGTDESRALDSATEGTIKTSTPATVTIETERNQTMPDLNKDDILKAERARVGAIRAMGVKFNLDEKMVERAIETDVDAMDFRADVLEVLSSRSAEETAPNDLDLSEQDASRFSITRAIRANENNDWKGAEFELECSNEIAERTGEESRGFYLPIDIAVRAALATGAGAGLADASGIVATDTAADKFIKVLKSKAVLGRLGATYLPGLIGDLSIPKQSGTSTAYWLGEDGDVSDSDFLIGNVLLSPKTIAAAVPITRRLMKQDSLAVDSLIINDILGNIALGIDLAGIEGDGTSNTPLGLVNTLGVNTVTIAAAATTGVPTFAETVAFESAIDADDALEGSLAYLTTAPIAGGLKTSPLDAGSGRFILEQGQANGYSVVKSNQIAAKRIAFGDWTNLLIAMWGALDMRTDTSTKAKSDGVVLRGFQDVDVALRQAQGFAVNA